MESFTALTAIAAPLLRPNIDTDQIIPTRFLARLSESGVGEGLFAEWRTRADGTPDPEFPLHKAPWDQARIIVAGANFGCGSSREAAARALRERGIRAVIAESFGDIFFNNCFRNGVLPVRLPGAVVQDLGDALLHRAPAALELEVDLARETVSDPARGLAWAFVTPPRLRRMLLQGLDEIGSTLCEAPAIDAFRRSDRARRPWAYLDL